LMDSFRKLLTMISSMLNLEEGDLEFAAGRFFNRYFRLTFG